MVPSRFDQILDAETPTPPSPTLVSQYAGWFTQKSYTSGCAAPAEFKPGLYLFLVVVPQQ